MAVSISRTGALKAVHIPVDRIASLSSWVKECHELYLDKDAEGLIRRAPEFLELAPFLRCYEVSMLTNHFAMVKLQREDFWHALTGKLIENGLPDPTPDDVALISDAYCKAHCFNPEVVSLLARQFPVIESRLEAYPLSVLMTSLANMIEYREDNTLAPRPREGFRASPRIDADDMLELLEPVAAWVVRNDHKLSALALTSILQGFTKLRYSNSDLYRCLAAATRVLAVEMSFEQVCANLASFNRLERHDRRVISALLSRLSELPEDEITHSAFLPSLVHVVGKLGLKSKAVEMAISRGMPACMSGLRIGELIRVLSMLPAVVHRPSTAFLQELFGPGTRCERELMHSHDQIIISVIVEAANRMAYSQLEFWELVLATIPREVAVSQWGAEPLVKCFVAVAKLETEIYPVSLPNFFHVMEPIVVREIPAWNPTIVTALTWGLLWRKQALRATVTAVLQFAQDNMATYGKAEVYRLVRLMASLDGDTVREWSPLIKMINRRVDQEHYAYSEHQCKLVEAFCNRFGVHVRIDVTQK